MEHQSEHPHSNEKSIKNFQKYSFYALNTLMGFGFISAGFTLFLLLSPMLGICISLPLICLGTAILDGGLGIANDDNENRKFTANVLLFLKSSLSNFGLGLAFIALGFMASIFVHFSILATVAFLIPPLGGLFSLICLTLCFFKFGRLFGSNKATRLSDYGVTHAAFMVILSTILVLVSPVFATTATYLFAYAVALYGISMFSLFTGMIYNAEMPPANPSQGVLKAGIGLGFLAAGIVFGSISIYPVFALITLALGGMGFVTIMSGMTVIITGLNPKQGDVPTVNAPPRLQPPGARIHQNNSHDLNHQSNIYRAPFFQDSRQADQPGGLTALASVQNNGETIRPMNRDSL